MGILIMILSLIVLNIVSYFVYTKGKTIVPYDNPASEFTRHYEIEGWIPMFFTSIFDIFSCRPFHKVLVGTIIEEDSNVHHIYYDTVKKLYSFSRATRIVDYDDALGHIDFWYEDNPTLRHKYTRVIKLLQKGDPADFGGHDRRVLKEHIIKATYPIV